jgi:hypothetical protein
MFGFTMALLPSSSMMLTPSMVTRFEVVRHPLIVMPSIDVHVVKLRFMFVSWTPGTTAMRPQTSRPFIGMLVSCSAVTVPVRELVAVCTAGGFGGDRERFSELANFQRQLIEASHLGGRQGHIGDLERREAGERDLDGKTSRQQTGDSEPAVRADCVVRTAPVACSVTVTGRLEWQRPDHQPPAPLWCQCQSAHRRWWRPPDRTREGL